MMIALAIVLIVIGCCTLGYVMGYSVGHRDGVRWVQITDSRTGETTNG